MEQLMQMKEMLIGCVQGQMTHLDSVDTKELGEAIDMIKDLSEAIYYCTVTEAMEKKDKESYHETMYYPVMYGDDRKEDWMRGRMYYDGNGGSSSSSNGTGTRHYSEREIGPTMRDQREGRSPMSRKNYMESKEMHKDKTVQMQELDKYAQELASDLVEMVEGASPEEKQYLSNKIAALAAKIK
jgi:hypothetical protein